MRPYRSYSLGSCSRAADDATHAPGIIGGSVPVTVSWAGAALRRELRCALGGRGCRAGRGPR